MTVDCTCKEKRRFLNNGKQIEKDKDEYGISSMWWYVYIMNIYLIVLFQTICKRVLEKVNEEVELLQEDEISFQLVMESVEEAIVLGDNMVAKGRIEDSKEGNSHSIIGNQWKRQLVQHDIVEFIGTAWDENYDVLLKENIHSQIDTRCLQGDKLDGEIGELWLFIQKCKQKYNMGKNVKWFIQFTMGGKNDSERYKETKDHLQHKAWDPRKKKKESTCRRGRYFYFTSGF